MRKPIRILLEVTALKPIYKLMRNMGVILQQGVAKQLQRLNTSSERLGPPKGATKVVELRNQGVIYSEIFPGGDVNLPVQRFIPTYGKLKKTEMGLSQKECYAPSFVITLDQARIYGANGLILTKEDYIIDEFAGSFTGRSGSHDIFRLWRLPSVSKVHGRVAVVGYNYAHGYYHWMLEILPRIEILRRCGATYDHIYMNPPVLPFQEETLKAVGFDSKKALWADPKMHIKVDQAIVPSLPGLPGQIPLWVCQYLRKMLVPVESQGQAKERLLISRRKAARRRILNEDMLRSTLEPFGFREVILEDYSVAEQARLFNQAEVVVAAHGAALTNLVFCSPGTVVVELFAPTRTYFNYQVLSQTLNLPYHGLLTSTEGLSLTAIRKQDMLVDCPSLLRYLQETVQLK